MRPPRLCMEASSTGRSAANGATAVAARAGTKAARTVSSVPTTMPATMADGGTANVAKAKSGLWLSRVNIRAMVPVAAKTPSTDAKKPTMSASTMTELRTCLRLAPMQRSSANSRVRWATRTENVFETTSAETSRATAAKASRTMVSWSWPPVYPATSCVVFSSAVRIVSTGCSTAAASAGLASAMETPGFSFTVMIPKPASWVVSLSTAPEVPTNWAKLEDIGSLEAAMMPETVACTFDAAAFAPGWPVKVMRSPAVNAFLCAVTASTTTSVSLAGHTPDSNFAGSKAGEPGMLRNEACSDASPTLAWTYKERCG